MSSLRDPRDDVQGAALLLGPAVLTLATLTLAGEWAAAGGAVVAFLAAAVTLDAIDPHRQGFASSRDRDR